MSTEVADLSHAGRAVVGNVAGNFAQPRSQVAVGQALVAAAGSELVVMMADFPLDIDQRFGIHWKELAGNRCWPEKEHHFAKRISNKIVVGALLF